MSKFEGHTPGPWKRTSKWIIRGVDKNIVCRTVPWDSLGCRIDDNADAELIAAAPDLLAKRDRLRKALKDLADTASMCDSWESFPSSDLEEAYTVLEETEAGDE